MSTLSQSRSSSRGSSSEPLRAKVSGRFKRQAPAVRVDPSTFKPSPMSAIETGARVLHLKFGEGVVKGIDGGAGNRIATIYFEGIDNPERRIMLKFAKLQVLS